VYFLSISFVLLLLFLYFKGSKDSVIGILVDTEINTFYYLATIESLKKTLSNHIFFKVSSFLSKLLMLFIRQILLASIFGLLIWYHSVENAIFRSLQKYII